MKKKGPVFNRKLFWVVIGIILLLLLGSGAIAYLYYYEPEDNSNGLDYAPGKSSTIATLSSKVQSALGKSSKIVKSDIDVSNFFIDEESLVRLVECSVIGGDEVDMIIEYSIPEEYLENVRGEGVGGYMIDMSFSIDAAMQDFENIMMGSMVSKKGIGRGEETRSRDRNGDGDTTDSGDDADGDGHTNENDTNPSRSDEGYSESDGDIDGDGDDDDDGDDIPEDEEGEETSGIIDETEGPMILDALFVAVSETLETNSELLINMKASTKSAVMVSLGSEIESNFNEAFGEGGELSDLGDMQGYITNIRVTNIQTS